MSWKILRPQIQTLIETIDGIAEVSAVPKLDFSGYPAVTISPSELNSDYETKQENLRTYAWQVTVFYNSDGSTSGVGDAISKIEETVDSIIDKLDQENAHLATRVIGANLEASAQVLDIVPVIGPWGYIEEQKLVVAEISVRVRISKDFEA